MLQLLYSSSHALIQVHPVYQLQAIPWLLRSRYAGMQVGRKVGRNDVAVVVGSLFNCLFITVIAGLLFNYLLPLQQAYYLTVYLLPLQQAYYLTVYYLYSRLTLYTPFTYSYTIPPALVRTQATSQASSHAVVLYLALVLRRTPAMSYTSGCILAQLFILDCPPRSSRFTV